MEINRKNFGGMIVVMSYLIWIRGGDNLWAVYLTSVIFCIAGVLILKEKGQRWYENNWFKVYVSVHVFNIINRIYGFFSELKLDWFVPEDALYVRPFHSDYTEIPSFF
ncbi:hypothetical protein [Bacillus sp. JCM 19034]|uniref:hypothetical protein n=1 Tax=Bacillus sp. JCM 19034 TaxID=1481928 RepID=UPI0007816155|nr:hypothetical protein [Bacillus sp. JCM 19034]